MVTHHCHQLLCITALLMNVPPLTQMIGPHLSCPSICSLDSTRTLTHGPINLDTSICSRFLQNLLLAVLSNGHHLFTPLTLSLSRHLLSASCMLGTVLETNNRQNKGENPCLHAPHTEVSPPCLLATSIKDLFCPRYSVLLLSRHSVASANVSLSPSRL